MGSYHPFKHQAQKSLSTIENKLYRILVDEEDSHLCSELSEEACQKVPGNFFAIFTAQFLSKLSDALASAKIVIPWLLTSVGAPAFFSGILVPIREAGSLLPQLFLGGVIRQYPIRKWFYVIGSTLQALVILTMAWLVTTMEGMAAGAAVTALLVLFSLARGLCSIASKDVLGKTIPKRRRGLLTGYGASAAGLVTVCIGGILMLMPEPQSHDLIWLLVLAAACWFCAALSYTRIREYPGENANSANALRQALDTLSILKKDADFRRFLLTRCLLMSSGLAAPYFIVLAGRSGSSDSILDLGVFVLAGGTASLASGVVWGKLADRSSRKLIVGCALLAGILCAIGSMFASYDSPLNTWLLVGLFFLLAVTHEGVRLGRKIYIVDLAGGNRRTDYVAVSNTVIGGLLLVVGGTGALLAQMSLSLVLAFYAASGVSACIVGLSLPEA